MLGFCRSVVLGVALAVLATAGGVAPASGEGGETDPVRARDHVQLRIDYLELKDINAPIKISVRVDGKTAWARELAAAPMHAGLGPVVGPPGARFNLTVYRTDGDAPQVVAAVTMTDKGKDLTKTFAKGDVKKLIVSTRGIDVWAIPELKVAVLKRIDDRGKKLVKSSLMALNKRVVDLSDGHIRIDRFSVYAAPIPDGVTADVSIGRCRGECPRAVGKPREPAPIRVARADADALTRGFGHAFLGVPDTESCFGAERAPVAEDEAEDEAEEPFDCRAAVTSVLREERGIALGSTTFPGPPPDRIPEVIFMGDTIDFGADDAGGAPPEAKSIDAVVTRYGNALGKCLAVAKARRAKIKLSLRGSDGRVMWVRVDGKRDGALVDCVTAVLDKARFPRSKSGRTVVEFAMSQ